MKNIVYVQIFQVTAPSIVARELKERELLKADS